MAVLSFGKNEWICDKIWRNGDWVRFKTNVEAEKADANPQEFLEKLNIKEVKNERKNSKK